MQESDVFTAVRQLQKLVILQILKQSMWIFGYGSLCWTPGFSFVDSKIGFIRGYSRKFWQGNVTHRGDRNQPGRVATLIEDADAVTYGMVFKLDDTAGLDYLHQREVALGGYTRKTVTVQCRDSPPHQVQALLFIATPASAHWLGPAPLDLIADQVLRCRGAAGHNVEYLIRLAEFLRSHAPESCDNHLEQLEQLVLSKADQLGVCLQTLMGRSSRPVTAETSFYSRQVVCRTADQRRASGQSEPREHTIITSVIQ